MERKTRSDKGKRRGQYKPRANLRILKESLEYFERVSDVRESKTKKQRRRELRDSLLPVDRICPCCHELKLESRQWVVVKGQTVMCLSCHRRST